LGKLSNFLKKNLPKVNNRPLGENSPNLVTLARMHRTFLMSSSHVSERSALTHVFLFEAGLPDFSWYIIPKPEKMR
jgi:hypothetical protein